MSKDAISVCREDLAHVAPLGPMGRNEGVAPPLGGPRSWGRTKAPRAGTKCGGKTRGDGDEWAGVTCRMRGNIRQSVSIY